MSPPTASATNGSSDKVDSTTIDAQSTDLNGVLMKGWFSEVNSQWPGMACSIEIEEQLQDTKSQYQHVQVFKTRTWGNMLVLDGVIQLTERDEMSYQEMMAHTPLFAHPNPENVLVIGGGDGGVIREICKHSAVKHVTICEIDQVVIDAGKKYFPSVAKSWDDKRVHLHVGDGAVFMQQPENLGKFDVIITDSSDPVGPAQALFESPFYQAMYSALRAGGKVCTQAESIWNNLDLIQKLVKDSLHIYSQVEYSSVQIPTYPAGQIGFLLCSKAGEGNSTAGCRQPVRQIPAESADEFRFYTSELHSASFVHPAFVQKAIDSARQQYEQEKQAQSKDGKQSGSAEKKSKA